MSSFKYIVTETNKVSYSVEFMDGYDDDKNYLLDHDGELILDHDGNKIRI